MPQTENQWVLILDFCGLHIGSNGPAGGAHYRKHPILKLCTRVAKSRAAPLTCRCQIQSMAPNPPASQTLRHMPRRQQIT